jgi:hypothetical protein
MGSGKSGEASEIWPTSRASRLTRARPGRPVNTFVSKVASAPAFRRASRHYPFLSDAMSMTKRYFTPCLSRRSQALPILWIGMLGNKTECPNHESFWRNKGYERRRKRTTRLLNGPHPGQMTNRARRILTDRSDSQIAENPEGVSKAQGC